ncbi:MAG: hypothetical protein IJ189_01360 [Clostridia bacterium]|nr:hypothetical protein [Clostridia bacterium]
MKRIQAACIYQTLLFSQKPDAGYTREQALDISRREVEHYKHQLERTQTRYQITDQKEQEDGSILIRVRKQYNTKAAVEEYFA